MLQHPNQIKWNEEPLPNVEEVPYDSRILVWATTPEGELRFLHVIHPYKNDLNPLRWCVDQFPLMGFLAQSKENSTGGYSPDPENNWIVKYWAWIEHT